MSCKSGWIKQPSTAARAPRTAADSIPTITSSRFIYCYLLPLFFFLFSFFYFFFLFSRCYTGLQDKVAKLEKEKQGLQEQEVMLKSVIAVKEEKIKGDLEKMKGDVERMNRDREAHMALEDQVLRLESDVRSKEDSIRVMTAKHGITLLPLALSLSPSCLPFFASAPKPDLSSSPFSRVI